MIKFNKIYLTGNEQKYIGKTIKENIFKGNGSFSKKICKYFEKEYNVKKCFLTPSATSALEMMSLILDFQPEDEIIIPSFTFVSSANAFALRNAKIKFVDIDPKNLVIDIEKIKKAITSKTKAIMVVNYNGVSVDFDKLNKIIKNKDLYLLEDNAQGIHAKYKRSYLGTQSDMSCISFHDTKNITSGGQGGALFINNKNLIDKAYKVYQNGTDKREFLLNKVDLYTWKTLGSSNMLSEINSAFLWAQLEKIERITKKRINLWDEYYKLLKPLEQENYFILQDIPKYNTINAHLFYLFFKTEDMAKDFKLFMKNENIQVFYHYQSLHNSKAGKKYGISLDSNKISNYASKRVIRLPLYTDMKINTLRYIVRKIYFWRKNYG
ncbi:MAG: dTDP-4-amino-4,6-dideoxygalactose transaminase [Bacillota bacterium]